ncbi:MAG: hypothetical protein LWY06_09755 [Firmicutes bacterium]|nr:hypothetical protein [Bacillota bacterium]
MFKNSKLVSIAAFFCIMMLCSVSCTQNKTGGSAAAPAKTQNAGPQGNCWDYFPGGDDDLWVYEMSAKAGGQAKNAEVVMCNFGKQKIGSNEGVLSGFYIDNWEASKNIFNVVGSEVIMYGAMYSDGKTVEYNPAAVVFKYPPKAGDKWTNPSKLNGFDTKYEVTGEEEVSLPAGKIKAWKIYCGTDYGTQGKKEVNNWYAEGIGLVKMEETTVYGNEKSVVTIELKGYRVNGKKGGSSVPDKFIQHRFVDREDNPYLAEMKEYFMMTPGHVDIYKEKLPFGDGKAKDFENGYEVRGLKIVDGREVLVIVSAIESQGYIPVEDYYYIEGDTIWKIGRSSARKGKMVPYLKFPLKDGAKWDFEGNNIKETNTVKGTEDVKTPAGTFKGIRIDSTSVSSDAMRSSGTSSAWYVKGKGYVKRVTKMALPNGKAIEIVEQLSEIHDGGH